jgi:hypothetical protein
MRGGLSTRGHIVREQRTTAHSGRHRTTAATRAAHWRQRQHMRPRGNTTGQEVRTRRTFPHPDAGCRTARHMRAESASARHTAPRNRTPTHLARTVARNLTTTHHDAPPNTMCALSVCDHVVRHVRTLGDRVLSLRTLGDSNPTAAHRCPHWRRCADVAHLAHTARRVRSVGACRHLQVGRGSQKPPQVSEIMAFLREPKLGARVRQKFAGVRGAFSRHCGACEVFATPNVVRRKRDSVMQTRYHVRKPRESLRFRRKRRVRQHAQRPACRSVCAHVGKARTSRQTRRHRPTCAEWWRRVAAATTARDSDRRVRNGAAACGMWGRRATRHRHDTSPTAARERLGNGSAGVAGASAAGQRRAR